MDIWRYLERFEGLTIHTLAREKPFQVKSVHQYELTIVLESTGGERTIARSEVEGAFNDLWLQNELKLADIRSRHSPNNPTYVAALLAELWRIEYKLGPIRLFMRY
jgi:hypothetical protein